MEKPGRTLGLSLAIIISVGLFSLLPIAQVIFYLSLQQQFQRIEFLETGGAIGGSIAELGSVNLIVPVINGIVFLLIAVLAWRGKPQAVRFMFVAAVIFITLTTVLLTASALLSPADLSQGIDSGGDLNLSLLKARLVMSLLVTLYVVWYVNRGPARAFYRGYYLPDPADAETQEP
jgi:hypothetical protein